MRPWIDESSRPDGADEHEHDRNQDQDGEDSAEDERKNDTLGGACASANAIESSRQGRPPKLTDAVVETVMRAQRPKIWFHSAMIGLSGST